MPLFLRQNHQLFESTSGSPVLTLVIRSSLQQSQHAVVKHMLYLEMMLGYWPLKSNMTTLRYSFISLISSTCPPLSSPFSPVLFMAVGAGDALNLFLNSVDHH